MASLRNNSLPAASSALLLAASLLLAPSIYAQAVNSCLDCHSAQDGPLQVTPEKFSQDIHAQRGLTCVSCHGGDASSYDPGQSMSRKAGWKGKIERRQIPQLCGSCHSNPAYMRQYNPSLRTDQLDQYHTSMHGKRLASGDTKVAVCVDCHSVHDLRPPSDPRSTVNPVNVARTCSRCHSDAALMKPYGIPTDQFANYSTSVHHDAMAVRGDLSAPTCTTCHGNHGALPPGVDKVQNVCSNCHVFQAQLFQTSPHKDAFAAMGFPGCVTCHSNHAIKPPTDEMIGTGPKAVCMNCHTAGDAGSMQAEAMHTQLTNLASAIAASDEILSRAERQGMEVSQPKLQQTQARDALLKARVAVHAFRDSGLKQDTDAGLATTKLTYAAGQKAMQEWRFRRVGLGLSLVLIALTLVGLGFYIRNLEQK